MLVRDARNPKALLGWSQMLLAGAVAWTAYMLANSLPYWPINPLLSTSPWFTFQIDMVRCLWALLPGHAAVGRELSARPGRRGQRGGRSGPPGRRHLRGQHRRRDSGRAQRQPDPGAVDRHAAAASAVLIALAGGQRTAHAGPAARGHSA